MKLGMSRAMAQPTRSRAVAMCIHSLAGSLSEASSDIQANVSGRRTESNHCATMVLLPYPAGAAINVTGCWAARWSCSTRRVRGTHSDRAGGGRSLASSMESTGCVPRLALAVATLVTPDTALRLHQSRGAPNAIPQKATLPGIEDCKYTPDPLVRVRRQLSAALLAADKLTIRVAL